MRFSELKPGDLFKFVGGDTHRGALYLKGTNSRYVDVQTLQSLMADEHGYMFVVRYAAVPAPLTLDELSPGERFKVRDQPDVYLAIEDTGGQRAALNVETSRINDRIIGCDPVERVGILGAADRGEG